MQFPNTQDTILAIASPWHAAPLGIVRLSGPAALEIAASVICRAGNAGAALPRRRRALAVRIAPLPDVDLPASLLIFPGPASATGQDVVEIHAPGNLPLLRALLDRLVAVGARRALPGEFTARAFLNGKIDAAGAAAVLELVHASDATSAREALRMARGDGADARSIESRLLALLARVEADIDFVDEEDVAAVSARQVREAITALIAEVERLGRGRAIESRHRRPHVALAGLPNAGKSTLFNALLGRARAIVAPVEGTTRDVLSAEIELAGRQVVLQDCAGLGATGDELELAAHHAAEKAADLADVILWVHDRTRAWTIFERTALARLEPGRVIVVQSKCDSQTLETEDGPADALRICAIRGHGLAELSQAISERLGLAGPTTIGGPDWAAVAAFLHRATLTDSPELVSIDLRSALDLLRNELRRPLVEDVLGFIFAQFCIGK